VDSMKAAMVPRMKLEISAAPDADGRRLVLRIKDNGEGALPETLVAAFERGFSTRTDKVGGIGLHWCANAVRAMDGELALESDGPGTGATAVLTLPLAEDALPISHAA